MTHVRTLSNPTEITSALRSLTPRQREVLSLAAGGLSSAEIGQRLSLPATRVNAYLKAAWGRLGGGPVPATIPAGVPSRVPSGGAGPVRDAGASEVGRLRWAFGLSQERFARLVGASPRTVARWEGVALRVVPGPATADRLAFLAEVRDLGTATLGEAGFRGFVQSRQPLLEGRRVIDVLEGEHAREVLDLLEGMAAGGPA